MCIIAISPLGKDVWPRETVKEMLRRNPDGCGVAFTTKNGVVFKKGMTSVDEVMSYLNKITNPTKRIIVLHARIATSGKVDALRCHPFPIDVRNAKSGRANMVFFHNGILSAYSGDKNLSDTQRYVLLELKTKYRCFGNEIMNPLFVDIFESTAKANSSRFVLMDKNEFITMGNGWITDDGYIYSGPSYRSQPIHSFTPIREKFDYWWEKEDKEDFGYYDGQTSLFK